MHPPPILIHPPLQSLWGQPRDISNSQLPVVCRSHHTYPTTLIGVTSFPAFKNSPVGIGKFCDNDCKVLSTKWSVTVFDPSGDAILTGWCETKGTKLWRFSLLPGDKIPTSPPDSTASTLGLTAYSAYNLPSVDALVCYFHATAGFPVKSTWPAAIKCSNYKSWPGLTLKNTTKYCRSVDDTIKGHLAQSSQGM